MRDFFVSLTRNPISLLGAAITTAAAVLILTLFTIELFGFLGNPYIGILTYLVLPGFLVTGLALIPLGVWSERCRERRARERGEPPPAFPVIDLNRSRTRTWLLGFVLLSATNVVILATATYKGVEVMESTEFCGQVCHSVMAPEFTAHGRSPHSQVACVECHIGPGADWFLKAKLKGAWQVVSVNFDLYPRPIPTPVHDLRPAAETCEQCHARARYVGDRLRVKTTFANDEANTELKTVLGMHIGGSRGGDADGIHWHVDPGVRIRYRSDEKRGTIHAVELTRPLGEVELFLPPGGSVEDGGDWRQMDCTDCHNRPTHIYRQPEVEVDLALAEGRLPRSLPFIRREGVRLLRGAYASHEAARAGIAEGLEDFYAENHPAADPGLVREAGELLGDLYALNAFPSMNVSWDTYPDHLGHEQSPGCFRCHDDEHATAEGRTIGQDCASCHALVALEEENPEIHETLTE